MLTAGKELWISTEDVLCVVCLGQAPWATDTQMNVCRPSFMTQSSRKLIPIVNDSMRHLTSIDWAAPYLAPISEDLVEEKYLIIVPLRI